MPNAIIIHQHGGSDQLEYASFDLPPVGNGDVVIDQKAIGLNFIDVYQRSGLYPVADFPAIIGLEGAGIISQVGGYVGKFSPGDRVAYASPPMGAYADQRVMPANKIVKLPDSIAFDTAAAMMLQGLTVQYLTRQTYKVKPGETIKGQYTICNPERSTTIIALGMSIQEYAKGYDEITDVEND